MFRTLTLTIVALAPLLTPSARAELMRATTAGIMCKSPEALAKLSLKGGATLGAGNNASPAMQATARNGGCLDVPAGNVVAVVTSHKNTSLIRSDTLTGDGVIETFTVPNVDYAPFTPTDEFANALRARCPTKLEDVVLHRYPTDSFAATLPRATQSAIDKAIEDECGGAAPCTRAQRHEEVRKRGLVPQWAAFMCRQK